MLSRALERVMSFPSTITVASYNMRKAIGTDRKRDPHRVLDVLHEIDADVIALQEAGYQNVRLYAGSWSDWISYNENPIATGEE